MKKYPRKRTADNRTVSRLDGEMDFVYGMLKEVDEQLDRIEKNIEALTEHAKSQHFAARAIAVVLRELGANQG